MKFTTTLLAASAAALALTTGTEARLVEATVANSPSTEGLARRIRLEGRITTDTATNQTPADPQWMMLAAQVP